MKLLFLADTILLTKKSVKIPAVCALKNSQESVQKNKTPTNRGFIAEYILLCF